MKRFLICLFSFLFIGCSIAGGAVLLSNSSYSDEYRGGDSSNSENDATKNAPTNDDLWTDSGNYADSFAGGTGTEEDPYQIATAEQLAYLAHLINDDSSTNSTYRSLYYVQTADIDLLLHYWEPIGYSSSRYFCGEYDGGDYTISNLCTESGNYKGLFGYIYARDNAASIHDLSIVGADVRGISSVGGLVGYTNGTISIYNCSYSGEISATSNYVGGLVGNAYSGTLSITNCSNLGSSVSGNGGVGGIVGYIQNYITSANISNCLNLSDVDPYGAATSYLGGIVGRSNEYTVITECINEGGVYNALLSSGTSYIGGIVGYNYMGTVSNCWNRGGVFTHGNSQNYRHQRYGGIAGYNSGTIFNCRNSATVYRTALHTNTNISGGGIAGSSSGLISMCYNEGRVYVVASAYGGSDFCNIGGIVGYGDSVTITNCYNKGYVGFDYNDSRTTTGSYIGGIAGYIGGSSDSYIANCYNMGSVSGEEYIGGVVGYSSYIDVKNCYNVGSVDGARYVGGVIGRSINSSYTTNCYWGVDCTLSSASGSGSTSNCGNLTESDAKSLNWYLDSANWDAEYPWDSSTVWGFEDGQNEGYPILQSTHFYLITYFSNYGTEEFVYEYKSIDESYIIQDSSFTREGYVFNGWNTNADGTGVSYQAGDTYSGNADLTLYAQWRLPISMISLDWAGIIGGEPNEIYLWTDDGYYLEEECITKIEAMKFPRDNGFTFYGFYSGMNGAGEQLVDENGNFLTVSTTITTWHAYFIPNLSASYDDSGYWYVELGMMPQTKVTDEATISALNGTGLTSGNNYRFGDLLLESSVYGNEEYCEYNGNWYRVEPIKWRLDYNSSQTSGFGTTTDTLAIMDTIVFVSQFSDAELNENMGRKLCRFSIFCNRDKEYANLWLKHN